MLYDHTGTHCVLVMIEVERSWRGPPSEAHAASNVKTNHDNVSPTKRRTRSNSKSTGTRNSEVTDKKESQSQQQLSDIDAFRPVVAPRNKYTHIIILKSLNETFETKFLVVPFKPESFKLGRPVVNSNANQGKMGKQDPQQLPQVRPDNGHFDSRVLSRNHASLSCDPTTGKIYIRDLKSSNGTFVNGNRIDQNDVELKVGDVIDLGTDIDSKFEHRKISAFVEDISVIPLMNDTAETAHSLFGSTYGETGNNNPDNAPEHTSGTDDFNYSAGSATTAQRAAFEAAMFGDVNNLDLEDTVLGSETEILSGIFINNSIGTSPNLINVIKTLATEVSLEKHEYAKLKSMESFLINYTTSLEYINKMMVEKNDKHLVKLQNALRQKLPEKQSLMLQEHKSQLEKLEKEKGDLQESCYAKTEETSEQVKKLENDLEDLRTRLEVEKYRNSQLVKNAASVDQDQGTQSAQVSQSESTVADNRSASNGKRVSPEEKKIGNGTLLVVSAVSIGLIAYALSFSSTQKV